MNDFFKILARHIARRSQILTSLSYFTRRQKGLVGLEELDKYFAASLDKNMEMTAHGLKKLSQAYFRLPRNFKKVKDPNSKEYRLQQSNLYQQIFGNNYSIQNEFNHLDIEQVKNNFFPYNTQSSDFVGDQLLSHGFLIKHLNLRPNSKVVEFGAGWGNLTLHLALMGHQVTAVEVNETSIQLMKHRASIHGRSIEFSNKNMVDFALTTQEEYDAAIFLASFHHADDHKKLIEQLSKKIKKAGTIIFADEPFFYNPCPVLPYPWGLRLDAVSLFYVRKFGWLELGFQYKYFNDLMNQNGFKCKIVPSFIQGIGDLVIATRG